MEGFDKTYFYLMFKLCTSCYSHGFYFPKYSKFPFLNQTWFSQNLFKKRWTIVLGIGFSLEQKGVSFQRKKKTESLECVFEISQAWHLRASLYLTIAWERSIVVRWIFHLFWMSEFCPSLGRQGRCVSKVFWMCELLCN